MGQYASQLLIRTLFFVKSIEIYIVSRFLTFIIVLPVRTERTISFSLCSLPQQESTCNGSYHLFVHSLFSAHFADSKAVVSASNIPPTDFLRSLGQTKSFCIVI